SGTFSLKCQWGRALPLNMRMVTGTWSASITATSRMVSDEQYNTSGSLKRIESTILSCECCRAHTQYFLRSRASEQAHRRFGSIFFLKLLPFPGQRHSLVDVGTGRQRFVEGI